MVDEPFVVFDTRAYRELARPLPRRRTRRWLLAPALVAAGIGTIFLLWPRTPVPVSVVSRGDIVHVVVALGRVETEELTELSATVPARIVQVHVSEGDRVRAGEVLVSLDAEEYQARRQEALRTLEAAQAKLAELKRGARKEQLEAARALVQEAQGECAAARARLEEIERGARPEERELARARLEGALAELVLAKKTCDRHEELWKQNVVSTQVLEEARARLQAAQARYNELKAAYDLVTAGPSAEERRRARAAVDAAEGRLIQAQKKLEEMINGATEEELRAAEAEVQRAQAALRRTEHELRQMQILAPRDGQVVRVLRERGELAQGPLVIFGAGRRTVRAEIAEADVYKVRPGQPVTITAEALPGRTLSGKIAAVAPLFGRKNYLSGHPKDRVDVKVLEAKIVLDEDEPLPVYMRVEVRLRQVVATNVLRVPAQALRTAGGRTMVRTPAGDREVIPGARDDQYVEIVSGLAEGDRVMAWR